MAETYKVGERYYVPVRVTKVEKASEGDRYPITASFLYTKKKTAFNTFADEPGLLLTAEDIALVINTEMDDALEELKARNTELEARCKELDALCKEVMATRDEAIRQNNELIAENKKLKQQLADANELLSDAQAQVKELTEADCMRLHEFKPIIEERDRLKAEVATRTENVKNLVEENDRLKADRDEWEKSARMYSERLCGLKEEVDAVKAELEQEKKRTQVWKDSSEEHRQRAEELEGDVKRYEMDISDSEVKIQRLGQENDSLKADILELKAQINAFQPDPKEIEELKKDLANARGQADLFKSERDEFDIQIQKYKDTLRKWGKKIHSQEAGIKQRDLVISLLAARAIELEEGGESNG